MHTDCNTKRMSFSSVESRKIEAAFDGGVVTSDAGGLLLGAADRAIDLTGRLAACFDDHRDQDDLEHPVHVLVAQRVFGLALGYEDVNDHDDLRHDPTLAALVGKLTAKRRNCAPLAGKSTLNRLELAPPQADGKYHRIGHDPAAIERLFVDLFLEAHDHEPEEIVLDLDATDDPLHGDQEGRFFHGYYDCYCYLPLYIFCGRHLLLARLRPANIDGAAGAKEDLERIVSHIRSRWPRTRIVVRGDSGFAREDLMDWCEQTDGVDYLFGLARNNRLEKQIAPEMAAAREEAEMTGKPARRFADFMWTTLQGWARRRRVVGKAEWLGDKANPRFVVTSLKTPEARELYEDTYCARGEMENRIKESQADLFADRTSTRTMRANQLRLWLSSMAYTLVVAVRRLGLAGTKLACATCGTIRLRLFKIGARVTRSVRRLCFAMSSACPDQETFITAYERLSAAAR